MTVDPSQSSDPVTVIARVPVDRGVQGVCNRLVEQATEIERLERQLKAAKRRRAALILKLRVAKLPLRTIERLAGISNVRVHQIEREAKR